MEIKSAYIYGFGKWQDFEMNFSGSPFVVITGNNESGKSTLRQFFLFMLYGFSPKKREFYQPKTGGKMGGRLTVSTEEYGVFTIERIHDRKNGEATCFFKNGETYQESWLKEQFNGIDEKTFASIFSFDSNELSQLHNIKAEELGDVLLGIGMAGTERIYATEKWLDNELNQLFKPQGKKPKINHLLTDIDRLTNQLNDLEKVEKTYNEKKRQKSFHYDEVEQLLQEIDDVTGQRDRHERQLKSYSLIQAYHQLDTELSQLPKQIDFPEQGMERYQYVKEQLMPIKSESTIVYGNIEKYENEIKTLQLGLVSDDTNTKIDYLLKEAPNYDRLKNEQQFTLQEKQQLKAELTNDLKTLQLGLSTDDLHDIFFPFHMEDTWSDLKQESEQIQLDQEKTSNELDSLHQQFIYVQKEKEKIGKQMLEASFIDEVIDKVNQKKQFDRNRQIEDFQIEQRKKWQKLWEKRSKVSSQILLTGLVISILIAGLAMFTNYDYMYVVSFALGIGVIVQKVWLERSTHAMEKLISPKDTNESTPIIDNDELHELEQILHDQEQLQNRLEKLQSQLNELQIEQLKIDERKNFFGQKQTQLQQRVDEQIENYPFLRQIAIGYWPKLYHSLKNCIDKYDKLSGYEKELISLNNEIAKFEDEVREFFKQQNWEESVHFSAMLDFMRNIVEEQGKLQNQIEQYTQWLKQTEDQKQQLLNKMKPFQDEMETLCSIAHVTDEESFIRKGNLNRQKESMQQKTSEYYNQLQLILSESELKAIAEGNVIEKWKLQKEFEFTIKTLENLESMLKQKRQELADVKSLIAHMERSEDYSVMKHRHYAKIDQLNKLAKQWSIYQVAKEKLISTKKVYQNNYLPKVIEQTSYYFKQLTNGNYVRVYPPLGGQTIQVENKLGIRYQVAELSQGTRDQLYVSLRIALSEITGEKSRMPFFIDDAFVHFDQQRREVMLRILLKLAKKQQVILFTCQDSLRSFVAHEIGVQMQVI